MKEDNMYWGYFNRLDFCNECKELEQESPFCEVCPCCGNPSYEKVIARWKMALVYMPGAKLSSTYVEYEIRKDVK